MRERLLEGFKRRATSESSVDLQNEQGYLFSVDIIRNKYPVYRIRLSGPERDSPLNSFFLDKIHAQASRKNGNNLGRASSASLECSGTTAKIDWTSSPTLTIQDSEDGSILHSDLPSRAYNLSANGIRHYSRLDRQDVHFGLGEVAAPINLTGRRFEMRTSDSASYDAYQTDPLYKHTPYLIRLPRARPGGKCTAYYSTSHSDSVWDIGKSVDEPWGAYKSFEVETGGLEIYIICGTLPQISSTMTSLTGFRPLMPPRWSLGYLSSSMGLAESDDPPAQALLENFLNKLEEHQIPCSAMHLSSGYTVTKTASGVSRNVFTLNKHRFPDFSDFCRQFHLAGLRIVPNIKPYVITTHPDYESLASNGALFYDPSLGTVVTTKIWALGIGDMLAGSWVDASSQAGYDWWCKGASELIDMGADGLWNDNNEYSLHDDAYEAAWELASLPGERGTRKQVGLAGRTSFTECLAQASNQALKLKSEKRRPYVLTRSANLNTAQYACSTWSGDNYTSWRSLRGNIAQTINASLSLYHSYGSDVGGFAGPLPDKELFLRWCQVNSYHTRFCIHSYKPNRDDPSGKASVNSPWMYPEILPDIRRIIQRRYELIPYLYSLHYEGHILSEPPVCWLGWGPFQQDSEVFKPEILEGADFWLGAGRLLIAGIFEAGKISRSVYLPQTKSSDEEVYYELFPPFAAIPAGSTVTVQTPLDTIPVFARSGSVLPIGKPCATITADITQRTNDGTDIKLRPGLVELDDWRAIEIFPPKDSLSRYTYEWIEDDGESSWPSPITKVRVEYWSSDGAVSVNAKWMEQAFVPLWKTLWIVLPMKDSREVKHARQVKEHRDGRTIYEVDIL